MIDEREHRRGLILGLTLAEVLLLLLFVLLLALAARFKSLHDENRRLHEQVDSIQGSIVTGSTSGPKSSESADIEPKPSVLDIYPEAASIDPNDPPQILKIIKEFLTVGTSLDNLTGLSDAVRVPAGLDPKASKTEILARTVTILRQINADKGRSHAGDGKPDTDKGKHNWPPIITLSEADGRFFQSGSAELSPELRATITGKVIPNLLAIVAKYDVNVIEVIGHTDEQPIATRPSDLDKTLGPYVRGMPVVSTVVPADNAGLGLARAATVARLLGDSRELSSLRILPLSGGQLINVDDTLSAALVAGGQEQRRRRIEIRVRRTEKQVDQQAAAPLPARRDAAAKASAEPKDKSEPPKKVLVKEQEKGFFENLFGP